VLLVAHRHEDRDVVPGGAGTAWIGGWKRGSAPPPLSGPQGQAEQAAAEQEGDDGREAHGSAGDSLLERSLDLAGKREAARLPLGKDQLVVDGDLEDPAGPLDELGLDAELLFDLLRQTGGAGVVVSDPAVLDNYTCRHEPCLLSPSIIANLLFKRGIKWIERLLLSYKVRLEARAGQSRPKRDWILAGTMSRIEIVQSPPAVEVACHGQDCRGHVVTKQSLPVAAGAAAGRD